MNVPDSLRYSAPATLFSLTLIVLTWSDARAAEATITRTSSRSLTTVSTSTSISLVEDWDNDRVFGVFPSQPIASLRVVVSAHSDYFEADAYCVFYGPGSEVTTFRGEAIFSFASLSKGELDQSQALFNCSYYTHEPHEPLSYDEIDVEEVEARNSEGELVPTTVCLLRASDEAFPVPAIDDYRYACGDATGDGGELTVADVLGVLRRAVGAFRCDLRICDTNHDEDVTTADAVKVLRRAVGLRSVLLCPPAPCG